MKKSSGTQVHGGRTAAAASRGSSPGDSPPVKSPPKASGGPVVSRRRALKAGVGTAVAAGIAPNLLVRRAHAAAPTTTSFDAERFLVHHATQGFDYRTYQTVKTAGYDTWLDAQLDPESIDNTLIDNMVAEDFPSLEKTAAQLYYDYVIKGEEYIPMIELRSATVLRSVWSRRQLYERMVEFWTDHFSIHHESSTWLQNLFIKDVVRKHALGSFPEMLKASAHSTAMLLYLTNDTNIVGQAQENYARELMELHTLGSDGPYSEQDVEEVAKIFTGWNVYGNSQFYYGDFAFLTYFHDYTSKTALGKTFPAGRGQGEGEKFLRILGRHKSTSEYISRKMTRWLLKYDPSEALVQKVAKTYRQTDGDIASMIRVIFDIDNVLGESPQFIRKMRRPYHFATGLCRASYAKLTKDVYTRRGEHITYWLSNMGQGVFGHPSPDGYPDSAEAWGRSMLPRWQFAQALFDRWIPSVEPDIGGMGQLIGGFDRDTAADQIDLLLTGGTMRSTDRLAVQEFIDRSPWGDPTLREAFALAASSPSYQWY